MLSPYTWRVLFVRPTPGHFQLLLKLASYLRFAGVPRGVAPHLPAPNSGVLLLH